MRDTEDNNRVLADSAGKPIGPSSLHLARNRFKLTPRATLIFATSFIAGVALLITNLDVIFTKGRSLLGMRPPSSLSVTVNAIRDEHKPLEQQIRESTSPGPKRSQFRIEYATQETAHATEILTSSSEFMVYYRDGRAPSDYVRDYFALEFPALDLLISNDGSQSIFVDRLTIAVEKSTPDQRPFLYFVPGIDKGHMVLHVQNEGWGPALKSNLTGKLIEGKNKLSTVHIDAGDIYAGTIIDVTSNLDNNGRRRASGRERALKIIGSFSYEETTPEGEVHRRQVTFGPTPFFERPLIGGGPSPASGTYEVLLKPEAKAYNLTVNTAHSLKAGETDRIRLVLGATKSSTHRFRILVHSSAGTAVERGPFILRFVIPRSNAIRIAENQGLTRTIGGIDPRYFLDHPAMFETGPHADR